MAKLRYPYKIYDSEGNELNTELDLSNRPLISDWPEFKTLGNNLDIFEDAHSELVKQAETENAAGFQKAFQSLAAFLFADQESLAHSQEAFNLQVKELYRNILPFINRVIRAHTGGFLGVGKNVAAYNQARELLKAVGSYVESKIISTPWHIPVDEEAYLLVALKDSPEAFVNAKNANHLSSHIVNLNTVKREHHNLIKDTDVANLPKRVISYASKVKQFQERFKEPAGDTFGLGEQIAAIEKKRQARWKPLTAIIDFFSGAEKKELEILKSQLAAAQALAISHKKVISGSELLVHQNNFLNLSSQLLENNLPLSNEDLGALRKAVVALTQFGSSNLKKQVSAFIAKLQESIEVQINEVANKEQTSGLLANQLRFLAKEEVKDTVSLSALQTSVAEKIKGKIDAKFETATAALTYIGKWEKINEVLKTFDITLYQDIQNKKNQYQSVLLLEQWDNLLDDEQTKKLTDKNVDDFIAAILWLDKPTVDTSSNTLIEALKDLTQPQRKKFQETVSIKLDALKQRITNDLVLLAKEPLSKDKQQALRHRLKFITQASSMYTEKLGELRTAAIETIKKSLKDIKTIKDLKSYIETLNEVLPPQLANDTELAALFKRAKEQFVRQSLSKEQKALHDQYKHEIEFLRTGKLALWDQIKAKFNGNDPFALTEDNISKWKTNFNFDYTRKLMSSVKASREWSRSSLSDAKSEDQAVSEIVEQYLKESISEDYKSIAKPLALDLHDLVDLRRKRLDKIFGLKQTADINSFMLRYFAMAEYQRYFATDATLSKSGADFIRQFHDMAQHEGGFTTQLVAKLPVDALNAMHSTWSENTKVAFNKTENGVGLVNDIVGEVDENRNTHVQLPRYLLLNMVLELIAADFDAILRGEKVDMKLLSDRIEFAMPKLKSQVRYESELNQNSSELRQHLKNSFNNLNSGEIDTRYAQLVTKLIPKESVEKNRWGFCSNLSSCEKQFLTKLKASIKLQIDSLNQVTEDDLNTDPEEKMLKDIQSWLQSLNKDLEELPSKVFPSEQDRTSKKMAIMQSIVNMEEKKTAYEQELMAKKVKLGLLKEARNNIETNHTLALLNDNDISLRDFITKIDSQVLNLLEPELRSTACAIKQNVAMAVLLKDSTFIETLNELKKNIQNEDINILEIVRNIPESVTRELPAETADTIRQLQYRFADRFNNLMVKMLDNNHLINIDKPHQQEEQPKELATSHAAKQTWSEWANDYKEWGKSQITLFKKATTAQPSSLVVDEKTAQQRLKEALGILKGMNADNVKHMFEQLAQTAEAHNVSLTHLYANIGVSEPVKIRSVI